MNQLAKIEKHEIVEVIESKLPDVSAVLPPNTIQAQQLQVAFLSAMNKKPDLRKCTAMSLCKCLVDCASIGILPETVEQHAYLIARNVNMAKPDEPPKWEKHCELHISYRGFVHLIIRGDRTRIVKSDIVHEGDVFEFENGSNVFVRHVADVHNKDRRSKPVIAAWALIQYPSGVQKLEVMDRNDLAKIRMAMKAQNKGKESPAWGAWETEMMRKAPIKRMAKTSDLGAEVAKAAEIDNEAFKTPALPSSSLVDATDKGAPEALPPKIQPADQDGHGEEPDLF